MAAQQEDRTSRYAKSAVVVVEDDAGNQLELRELREIPHPSSVLQIMPNQSDRLDLLSFRYYRDPLLFWILCDASPHMDPFDVAAPGEPQGVESRTTAAIIRVQRRCGKAVHWPFAPRAPSTNALSAAASMILMPLWPARWISNARRTTRCASA